MTSKTVTLAAGMSISPHSMCPQQRSLILIIMLPKMPIPSLIVNFSHLRLSRVVVADGWREVAFCGINGGVIFRKC